MRIYAAQESVVEGENATFTLTRTGAASGPLAVRVSTYEPSHPQSSPTDFDDNPTLMYHDVTFQDGENTATLSVAVDDDGVSESDGTDSIRATIIISVSATYSVDQAALFADILIDDPRRRP